MASANRSSSCPGPRRRAACDSGARARARATAEPNCGEFATPFGSDLHVREPLRAAGPPRTKRCLRPPRDSRLLLPVLMDENAGLKRQIGEQARSIEEVRQRLREAVEHVLQEKRHRAQVASDLGCEEQRVADLKDELASSFKDNAASREQLSKFACDQAEWAKERQELEQRLEEAESEKEAALGTCQEESAALKSETLINAELLDRLEVSGAQLRDSAVEHIELKRALEQQAAEFAFQATQEQTAAAFEWAAERRALLEETDRNKIVVGSLKEEMYDAVIRDRTSRAQHEDVEMTLKTQLQMVIEDRDTQRLHLAELRRKSAEDIAHLSMQSAWTSLAPQSRCRS